MFDVECPYCGHQFDVCTDDGAHCDQDTYESENCPECENTMMVETSWYPSRESFKAQCLNKDNPDMDDHDFKEWVDAEYTTNGKCIFHSARKCNSCSMVVRNKKIKLKVVGGNDD